MCDMSLMIHCLNGDILPSPLKKNKTKYSMVYTIFSTSTKRQHLNVYQTCTFTFIFYICNNNNHMMTTVTCNDAPNIDFTWKLCWLWQPSRAMTLRTLILREIMLEQFLRSGSCNEELIGKSLGSVYFTNNQLTLLFSSQLHVVFT
jgi:hypothetical protein